jgi:site-specific DNA recombinase
MICIRFKKTTYKGVILKMYYSNNSFKIDKVIIYPRKSREDIEREKETGEDCLAAMTEMLVNAVMRYQIPNHTIRPEIGSADTIDGRPVFREILEADIPSGNYQSIAVREISRLGRGNFTDAGRIYDALIDYNFYVITPHRIYDPSNPADRRQIRMELFFAREEYENIKERLWEYRNAKAKKGFAGNRSVTYGLTSVRGKWIIVPEEAAVVVEIFEMRARNMSYPEIANILNGRRIRPRSGTKFHQSTIGKILKNKRYIGISTWKGVEYPAQHPAIVSMELWNQVRFTIQPQRTHQPNNPRDNEYLVELYCRDCGNRMYGYKENRKHGSKYMVYRCDGRKDPKNKCSHSKSGEVIHRTIYNELKKILTNPEILQHMSAERQQYQTAHYNEFKNRLSDREKLLKQKEKFLVKLDNDYEAERLVSELYNRRYAETQAVINTLAAEIAKLKKDIKAFTLQSQSAEMISGRLQLALEQWDSLPNKKKKAIIKAFFPKIEIDKNGTFYIMPNLPYTLEL